MNMQEHTQPAALTRYSFVWSEVRLVVAAVALFLGGVPPIYFILPGAGSLVTPLLRLAWIISGVASGYLLYRWSQNHQVLFGGKERLDTAALWVSVVSGLNLGLVGLLGTNIGMNILSGRVIFTLVGVIYLAAAYHLYQRWSASGQKVF
jgi:uncharacterized membrane protein YuzA (DUF378 family)